MVPMQMFASTFNYEVPKVTAEKKVLPKAKENTGARFESVLKRVSNSKDSKLGKIREDFKPNNLQSQDIASLIQSLPDIGLLLSDADQEKLINELNMALEEMEISLLDELDTQDLAVINEMIAALTGETAVPRQDVLNNDAIRDEIRQIILAQLLKADAKPELNHLAVMDEEVKMPVNTSKEVNPELASSISKQEMKPKSSSESKDFRLMEDKVSVKTDNSQSKTDIKKLISSEINRINGVKQPTQPNNNLMAEQPPASEEETPEINSTKVESLETRLNTKITQTVTQNRPVEVKEVIDQIVKKAELLLKQNASEIKISLKPEFLGRMTIKIAVEEGILTARFITDNLQTKHLLESNLNTLRQSLESQGIKVEKTEVNVQLNNGGMFDGSEHGRESRWERPEHSINYRGNEAEEAFTFSEDVSTADEKAGSGYLEFNEEGALSFLI